MNIREAAPEESELLQRLQAGAPQGRSLVVSTVNVPDFFSRARCYESCTVYNAYEDDQIIGSAACAIREGVVGGRIARVGYEFQYFTAPESRKRGVARSLRRAVESHLTDRGVVLSYALIMEGNTPSMRLFEGEGFYLHRKLLMPSIAVTGQEEVPHHASIRCAAPRDLAAVASLLNRTWRQHDLFEPASAASLARQVERTEALDYCDLLMLEDGGRISACVALWDWSKIMRITVLRLNLRMRLLGRFLVGTRRLPSFPGPGDTLRQMMLTMIGYESPAHLVPLLRHVNNLALAEGVEQVFCICERDHRMLESMKGFTRIDTGVNLYVKLLRSDVSMSDATVAMTGLDM